MHLFPANVLIFDGYLDCCSYLMLYDKCKDAKSSTKRSIFSLKIFCPCLSVVDAPCAKYMTVAYTEYIPNHVTVMYFNVVDAPCAKHTTVAYLSVCLSICIYGQILMSFFASLSSFHFSLAMTAKLT